MSRLFWTVRFILGLCLVAAGGSLAAPFVADVLAAHARSRAAANDTGVVSHGAPADGIPRAQIAVEPAARAHYAAHSIPDASFGGWEFRQAEGGALPVEPETHHAMAAEHSFSEHSFSERLVRAYTPPAPPARLPGSPPGLSQSAPPLDSAYRSTLDVPPPPLLDADTPPPLAVAWNANDNARASAAVPAAAVQQPLSSTYVVRDGDDLTGIATRIYGHPGAAGVIWSVNRDRLTDPAVLPIGMELRIPPSWEVPAIRGPGASAVATIEPVRRPARVRVAAGETLESLAQRFYGDKAMASRLWEANRDQLRSPALLVAGMELRLP